MVKKDSVCLCGERITRFCQQSGESAQILAIFRKGTHISLAKIKNPPPLVIFSERSLIMNDSQIILCYDDAF